MKRMTTKNQLGFSLLELMVVVAIIGVLATFAIPRFNIFRARARQGEAKSNLGVIFTLQEAFKIDKEVYFNGDSSAWGGEDLNDDATGKAVGYVVKGALAGEKNSNKLGFRLANPSAARYRYWVQRARENEFITIAAAHSDQTVKRIFPGCAGSDSAAAKRPRGSDSTQKCWTGAGASGNPNIAEGDAFCLDHTRYVDNFKDIVSAPDCDD